jgi:hypothetical protein
MRTKPAHAGATKEPRTGHAASGKAKALRTKEQERAAIQSFDLAKIVRPPKQTPEEVIREMRAKQGLPAMPARKPLAPKVPAKRKSGHRTDQERARIVLAKVGVTDPENDPRVRLIVETGYHLGELIARDYKDIEADNLALARALQAVPLRTETGKEKRARLLLLLPATSPKPAKPGRRENVAIRSAIGCADQETWTWKEAAAAVFLLAPDGRRYDSIYAIFKDHDARRLKKLGA